MSRRNSPMMQAGGAMKPLSLVVGSAELPLLRKQTADFAGHRARYGLPVTYEEIPGADHFTIMDEIVSPTGRITTLIRQLFEGRRLRSVIAREAKQSRGPERQMDCFVATLLAMTAVGGLTPARADAAVNRVDHARGIAGAVGGQERHQVADLARMGGAAERKALSETPCSGSRRRTGAWRGSSTA